MQETLRFMAISTALGVIAVYGSETLFWSFPPEGMNPLEYLMVVIAYSLCAATVQSVVLLTGARGWRGFWLAGALLGFLVEGVLVGTMYDAFPFQLIWTPLAWHMLLTVGGVLGLTRLAVRRSLAWQCAAMAGIGLLGGFWTAYWPIEHPVLPNARSIWLYQMAGGILALLAFLLLNRIGNRWPVVPRWALWIMPAIAALLFIAQSVPDPRPERLALPIMLGLTFWGMSRSKNGLRLELSPDPAWRYLPFLLVPIITAAIGSGLVLGTAGFESNIVFAVITAPVGFGLWLWQVFRRPPRQPAMA